MTVSVTYAVVMKVAGQVPGGKSGSTEYFNTLGVGLGGSQMQYITASRGQWQNGTLGGTVTFPGLAAGTYSLNFQSAGAQWLVSGEGYTNAYAVLSGASVNGTMKRSHLLTLTFSNDHDGQPTGGRGLVAVNGVTYRGATTLTFEAGTSVTLSASPDLTSRWGGFNHAGEGTTQTTTLTMNSNQSIDANFFIPLVVNNPPAINWTSTFPSTLSSGSEYTVAAHATDDGNLRTMVIKRNGSVVTPTSNLVRPNDGDVSYKTTDVGAASGNTTITYTATATDAAGLSATISQDVVIGPKPSEPTLDGWITATVSTSTAPGSAKVSWSTSYANSATVTGTNNFSSMSMVGSQDLTGLAAGTYTYTLNAAGANGATLQRQATFTIAAAGIVTADITATPVTINLGETAKIDWNSANATSISVTGPSGFSSNLASGSVTQQGLGAGTYTFTITAQGNGGPVTKSATLKVVSPDFVDAWISTNPTNAPAPASTTVSWGSSNAAAVSVITTAYGGAELSTALSGSQTCTNLSTGTYTFTITAQGPNGPVTKTASFTATDTSVQPPPSRNLAINFASTPIPWSGGNAEVRGSNNVSGPGILRITKKIPTTTTTKEWDGATETYVDVTTTTYASQPFSQTAINMSQGPNVSFGSVNLPRSAQDGRTITWEAYVEGTDSYKGFAYTTAAQAPIPPAQEQTITITPVTYAAQPGELVSLTAAGGKTSYLWSGADSSNGATATFRVPTGAGPGDTFTVSVYCPAGGDVGSSWAQSNTAIASICVGNIKSDANFSVSVFAPTTLPYTGGDVDIQIVAQQKVGTVSGTVTTSADILSPSSAQTLLGAFPYGIAPNPAVLSHKKTTIPMNMSAQPAVYTVRARIASSVSGGPMATQTITVAPMPSNAPPAISLGKLPTFYFDGYSLWEPYGGTWTMNVYSPGTNGTVTNSVSWDVPGGTTFATGQVRWGSTTLGSSASVPPNTAGLVYGKLPSAFPNPPPIGNYSVVAMITNSQGQSIAQGTGKIVRQSRISALFDAPGYDTGTTETDPDTGEQIPVYDYPDSHGWDIGWNTESGSAWAGEGEKVHLYVKPGSDYLFVRWHDQDGNTMSYNMETDIIAEAGDHTYFAQLRLGAPTPVTFNVAPLSFVYDGTVKAPTVTPSVAGLPFSLTGTGSATNVSTYTATVTTVPGSAFTGSRWYSWSIAPKPVTFTFGNLTQQYDGTPKPATVTPSDSQATYGVTYTGTSGTSYGPSSTAPAASGAYTVRATANGNYSGISSATLTITKEIPTITWTNPVPITYGTPLSGTQLNATASVPGTFAYTPAAGAVLNAGKQTLSVLFTPIDTTRYANTSATVTLTVNKATPTLSWASPAAITYGTALSATQLNATASVPGSFGYTPASGAVLGAGAQTLSVAFTPTDAANFNNASGSVTLIVNKATPTITWATPAAITYGTVLSPTQLAATGSVPGGFSYSPVAGTVLDAGPQTLRTTFIPTDVNNYATATASVTLTVNKAVPTITWGAPAAITYGTALSGTQLNATADVPGSFTYSPAAGIVLGAGSRTLTALFTPTDSGNYSTANASVTLDVNKASLAVTAANQTRMYGTANPPLTYTITGYVNGDAPSVVTGSPAVSTTATAASPVGTYPIAAAAGTLSAENYSFGPFVPGTLTVTKASLTATANDQARTYGSPNPALTLRYDGFLNGDTATTITAPTAATTAAVGSGVGRYPITLSGGAAANYALTLVNGTLTVTPAMLTVVPDNQSRLYGDPNPPLTYAITGFVNGESAAATGGAPLVSTTATPTTDAGSYPITATRGTLTATNYDFDYRTALLLIRLHPATFTFSDLNHVYDGTRKTATVVPSEPGVAYTAVLTGGPDAGSYTVSATATHGWTGTSTATMTIVPAAQTISVSPVSMTAFAGQPVTFTATGGHNAYTWTSPTGSPGSDAVASLSFVSPGTYSVSVANAGSKNYLPSNTAVATITVVNNHVVTSLTPVESNYTVSDAASPMNGQTYRRLWRENGWSAYLGRPGVKFAVKAQAWPAVKALELQAKPVGGTWSPVATHTPTTALTDIDHTFSIMLGEVVPGQPLVPLSFQQGSPQTGAWAFRARVQDANGEWSAESAEVAVQAVLPMVTKTVSGQTVPPAGDLGAWFTASPVKSYAFPLWIP